MKYVLSALCLLATLSFGSTAHANYALQDPGQGGPGVCGPVRFEVSQAGPATQVVVRKFDRVVITH